MLYGVNIEEFLKKNKFTVNPRLFGLIQAMTQFENFKNIQILNRTERLDLKWGIQDRGAVIAINLKNKFEIFDMFKFYEDVGNGIKHPDPIFVCDTIEECCNKFQFFIQHYYG